MNAITEMQNKKDDRQETAPALEPIKAGQAKEDLAPFDRMSSEEQKAFIACLRKIVGDQWVETDPCILDTYAWQMNAELIGDTTHFMPRAIAIVLPNTTEEVSGIMKHCHCHGIQCKPMGSG